MADAKSVADPCCATSFHASSSLSAEHSLHMTFRGLLYRSVSVAADEPLLIANLNRLNVASILERSSLPQRMQRLWSLMPQAPGGLPVQVIFWPGPRLDRPAFRWAPASLLAAPSSDTHPLDMRLLSGSGEPTGYGLRVSLPGYRMAFPSRPRGAQYAAKEYADRNNLRDVLLRRDDGTWFFISRRPEAQAGGELMPCKTLFSAISAVFAPHMQLIYTPRGHVSMHTRDLKQEDAAEGLLVEETGTDGDTRYVHSKFLVYFGPLPRSPALILEAAHHAANRALNHKAGRRLARLNHKSLAVDAAADAAIRILAEEAKTFADRADLSFVSAVNQESPGGGGRQFLQAGFVIMASGKYGLLSPPTEVTQQWCVD